VDFALARVRIPSPAPTHGEVRILEKEFAEATANSPRRKEKNETCDCSYMISTRASQPIFSLLRVSRD
jgi:hypothetical protein